MSPVSAQRPARRPADKPITKRRSVVQSPPPARATRCVAYCRKSTTEGQNSDFTSIDAQREACEAFITSQRSQGWEFVEEPFDDYGYTGGNTDRPGLQRLLAAVERGEIDCVVVYKIDRLSRSLLDFVQMLEMFDQHNVSFVAVTQQINTATSMGRLMLNVLMSFAQFERELISERTSDKMCAARKKGKWMGGPPILGYDIDRENRRLVVNPEEAEMVRQIFDLYIGLQSALKVTQELNRRGWRTKTWTRKSGEVVQGTKWTKAKVLRHVMSVTYIGKVEHKGELYEGQHDGIIDPAVFEQVQEIIARNRQAASPLVRNKHGALLKGLIRCAKCGAAMAHTYTNKQGTLYRYYVCDTVQKQGRSACPTPSLAANDIERFVVTQIRKIGSDPVLVQQVYEEAMRQQEASVPRLKAEYAQLLPQRQQKGEELKRLLNIIATADDPLPSVTEQLRETEELTAALDKRLTEVNRAIDLAQAQTIDSEHLRETLQQFDPIWDVLHPAERVELVQQLVDVVTYNADDDTVSVTFHHAAPEQPRRLRTRRRHQFQAI